MHAGRSALCIPKALLTHHLCQSQRSSPRGRKGQKLPRDANQELPGLCVGGSYHWGSRAGIGGLLGEERACRRASGVYPDNTIGSLNPAEPESRWTASLICH